MSSTRLPGKVMADLVGAPMILRQIERLSAAGLDQLIVATSEDPSDDPLDQALRQAGHAVFRGSLDDVLGRFAQATRHLEPQDLVVRLTADCPLTDPSLIRRLVDAHQLSRRDYTATTWPRRTFPKGLDAEVLSAALLRHVAEIATDAYDREHVTPFVYRQPESFNLGGIQQTRWEGEACWTVDTAEDLAFVREIYRSLYGPGFCFTTESIRSLVRSTPTLRAFGGARRL